MKKIFALMAFVTWNATANAEELTSVYTNFDITTCQALKSPTKGEDYGSGEYLCKGIGGNEVYIREGDLRAAIAFGVHPQHHCAAVQSFDFFNNVVIQPMAWRLKNNSNGVDSPKIEWRLKNGKPVATIVRWSVTRGYEHVTEQRSILVVTKLEEANSCRIAVVDDSFPNANLKARELADNHPTGVDCILEDVMIFAAPGVDADILASTGACFDN